MKKYVLPLMLVFFGLTVAASENYICEFGPRLKHISLDQDNPKAVINKDPSRFTFIVNDKGGSKYINMRDGVPAPLHVIRTANRTVFVEDNLSDNQFVVTVFLSKSKSATKPALFTFHGWANKDESDFFMPGTAVGRCTITEQ